MKRICPNNKEHKEFSVVCHVTEEWIVDENGEFLELLEGCIDITYGPNDSVWYCTECGAEARAED